LNLINPACLARDLLYSDSFAAFGCRLGLPAVAELSLVLAQRELRPPCLDGRLVDVRFGFGKGWLSLPPADAELALALAQRELRPPGL